MKTDPHDVYLCVDFVLKQENIPHIQSADYTDKKDQNIFKEPS